MGWSPHLQCGKTAGFNSPVLHQILKGSGMMKRWKIVNRLGLLVILIRWMTLPTATSEAEWWKRWLFMGAAVIAWAVFVSVLVGVERAWKAYRGREREH